MIDINITEITLDGYSAMPKLITLGTAGSYGTEQLHFLFGSAWANLDAAVTFHPPRGDPVQRRLPSTGLIDVPAEAMAAEGMGSIVAAGYAEGVCRISCSVRYRTLATDSPDGAEPAEPTPSLVQQILAAANNAEQVAQSVRQDADDGKFIGPPGPPGDIDSEEVAELVKNNTLSNLDIDEILQLI